MMSKDEIRSRSSQGAENNFPGGRIAEVLRRDDEYRRSKQIFVVPSPSCRQIRINALLDGKQLLMPAPGLKDGFYILKPFVIPLGDLGMGVTYKGLAKYGRRLKNAELAGLAVDLVIGDCLAVDRSGGRLGSGKGYFDLAAAILNEYGSCSPECLIYAVADEQQISEDDLPQDNWDVKLDGIVGPTGIIDVEPGDSKKKPSIDWSVLSAYSLKKITPIWNLQQIRDADPA